ncbi:MAG: hypothetical protein J0M04_20995 [Verrucomicrobia bacterium]|nr:hypothetical protein [Verrucomicrobiota bacterium]
MSATFRLTCGILLGLQIAGLAQNVPATEVKTPDFSEGFKRLAALGLPSLDDKAVWVTSKNTRLSYQFQRSIKGFKGNAWQAGTGKDAIMVEFGAVRASTGAMAATKPDLDKDVATLIEALRKADPQGTESDGILGYRYSPGGMAAEVFVFAAQLHQTGHADAANRVATALFDAMPSRENLVDQVVGRIASKAYDEVAEKFFETGDWAAYHRDAAALVEKFPRGWSLREPVAMLLPLLENRAKGGEVPSVSLSGVEIPEKAAAIAAELLAKPAPAKPGRGGVDPVELRGMPAEARAEYIRYMYGRGSSIPDQWLVNEAPTTADIANPLMKLAALGTDALPALAAVLGDTTLTHRRNLSESGYDSPFGNRQIGGEDQAAAAFQSLNRPASRGEIARMMLKSALPDPDDSLDETDDESLKSMAIEFWQAHRNHSREELAVVFLRSGSSRQVSSAASVLASAKDEKYHKLFEEHILALDPAYPAYQDVTVYLKSRGKAGKDFFESYAKLIRAQAPDPKDDDTDNSGGFDQNTYMLREAGGVEQIIKSLAPLVGDKTPRDIALEIARGKPADAEAAIEALAPVLEELKPLKRLHALLGGASVATDTGVRARFLHACLEIEWYDEDEDEEEPAEKSGEPSKPAPVRAIGPVEAGVWRKLIADTAKIPKELASSNPSHRNSLDSLLVTETIGDLACYALEASMETDQGIYGIIRAAELLGKKSSELVREFAVARLDGKAPPSLPDAEKVSEDRLKEIIAAAGALKPTEIGAHIKTLTPDEQAKWLQWITDPEDIEVPPSVKAMAWIVQEEMKIWRDPPWPGKYQPAIKTGFLVSPENVLALFKEYAAKPDESTPRLVVFRTSDDHPGLSVTEIKIDLTAPLPKAKPGDGGNDEDEEAAADPSAGLARWRDTFKTCIEALEKAPSASGAIHLQSSVQEEGGHKAMILIDKDGNLSVVKDEDEESPPADAPAAIKAALGTGGDPQQVVWIVLARKHLDALMKDPTPETPDPSEILPPP